MIELFYELQSLFELVKELDNFKKIILESVNQISKNVAFNFKDLSLVFVDCDLQPIYGFAGKNKIYMNVFQFLDIKKNPKFDWCSVEKKEVVIKLEFIRLMFHETSHVVLRSNTQDLNSSSPLVEMCNRQNQKLNEEDLLELGYKTEIRVFHGILDIYDSFESQTLNISYCCSFLEDFLSNKEVKFNLEESKAKVIDEKDTYKMALYYYPKKIKFFY